MSLIEISKSKLEAYKKQYGSFLTNIRNKDNEKVNE